MSLAQQTTVISFTETVSILVCLRDWMKSRHWLLLIDILQLANEQKAVLFANL